jgi:hypothetical protein
MSQGVFWNAPTPTTMKFAGGATHAVEHWMRKSTDLFVAKPVVCVSADLGTDGAEGAMPHTTMIASPYE